MGRGTSDYGTLVLYPLSYGTNVPAGFEPASSRLRVEVTVVYATDRKLLMFVLGAPSFSKRRVGSHKVLAGEYARRVETAHCRCLVLRDCAPAPAVTSLGRVFHPCSSLVEEVSLLFRHRRLQMVRE